MSITNIKKISALTSLLGFFYLILFGSFLHFSYELLGRNSLLAAFVPVNESIWEHLKLILFPAALYGVFEYFLYGKKVPGFLAAKCLSILIGMLTVLMGYYTYSGILGRNFFLADIALYFLASALVSYLTYRLGAGGSVALSEGTGLRLLILLTGLMILFFHFTYRPPMLELFRDPITEDFGIAALQY